MLSDRRLDDGINPQADRSLWTGIAVGETSETQLYHHKEVSILFLLSHQLTLSGAALVA